MKTTLNCLLLLLVSFTTSHAQEPAELMDRISHSIQSAFQEAKTAVSNQYYKTEIDFIQSVQQQDYNKYLKYYDSLSFWDKVKNLLNRWNAKRTNDKIIKAGDNAQELLEAEPFDEEKFHKKHTYFLQLREQFLKDYSKFSSPAGLYNQPQPYY